jgi:hypothetical protein
VNHRREALDASSSRAPTGGRGAVDRPLDEYVGPDLRSELGDGCEDPGELVNDSLEDLVR